MAKLINGNGNPAVYASEDSDWYAAIMGNVTSITAIGEKFRADQADANTIEVFDGVIITQEGRRIQLDANDVDLFTIPTGTPGDTSYYIIGYHLVTDSDSNQSCETFVQKMEDGTETIPEDTFRGGADDVYISLYRITQDGLNIDSIDLLLPSISNISEIKSDLTEIINPTSITVQKDGTKTNAQLLALLAPQIDFAKVTSKSHILWGTNVMHCVQASSALIGFSLSVVATNATELQTWTINLNSSSGTFWRAVGSTCSNYSSAIAVYDITLVY